MTIKVTYNVTDVYVTQDVSPVYINVSYSSGGGSGAAVWGSITGTLSDQTDLQTALDAKFDDPTGTSLQYIDGTGALQTFPLTLPVLQEVRNQTGATLDAGTVVYINGATGNKPTVTKAIATGDSTSAQTLGMVSASIANNGVGYVVVIGTCSGLDTSAYTEGQQLYLSYTTAGAVTTTKPYAPYHLVYIGIVTRAHPTLGTVEVRVQNGYELDEIHDVDALNPNNNDGIFYNTSTSLWEHKQISTALGYTPANAATTLTINGVTYDLSTSRTWSVGSVTGSGASGQVAYWTGTSAQSGSNNLFWDNSNIRLGIGANTPSTIIDAKGDRATVTITDTNSGGSNPTFFGAFADFLQLSVNRNPSTGIFAQTGKATSQISLEGAANTSSIRFFATNSNNTLPDERLRLYGTGNLLIQSGGTYSDGGQRLQVQGTTLLNGNVTFSSSTGMFWDATNSRLGIGTNAPANELHITKNYNGQTKITVTNTTSGTLSAAQMVVQSTSGSFTLGKWSSATASYKILSANVGYLYNDIGDISILNDVALGNINFAAGSSSTAQMTLHNTGNLLLGSTSNSGERLQVTGTMKVTNEIYATSGIVVGTSGSGGIVRASATNAANLRFTIGGSSLLGAYGAGIQNSAFLFNYPTSTNTDANTNSLWGIIHTFAPTSGSSGYIMAGLQPTINQTGGANGITRGLYVNPTLTAAADWRSIEWSNNSGWGLYGAGTSTNYLGGRLHIGSTGNSAIVNLWVNRNISGGSFSYGIIQDGLVQSDVITSANGFTNTMRFAASVTNANYYHFNAEQGTIGAGTTIANQFGYFVNSNTTGATNNYGFYGNIPSGTGRWNLYMNGTAANYMAGNLLLGSTTDSGQRLQVYGDTLLRGSGNTSATTALTVQNSSSTNLLTVRNDGNVGIGVASSSYPLDVNNTGTSATFNVTARFLQLSTQNGTGAFASGSGLSYRPQGNQSAQVLTWGVNTGQNIGGSYLASNGNTNIAGWFSATVDKNSAANIGIASFAVNNGTSPTQVAGYFALAEYGTSLPTFTNAAIVADNGATTSPIFIGRDNGSTVFTIADGGNIGIGNTPTAAIDIKASTTTAAAMRFRSGTAPTTPNDGDIWFDGTDIKMRIGGVTKTFTLT